MKAVVLTGGVGGAKLVLGLSHVLPPENITAIINTGDDFTHLGLPISPDIDTVLYTLANKANAAQGWGRTDESWQFMAALKELGGADWFQLGDGDLALHVLRLAAQQEGESLSVTTARFAKCWGIGVQLLPMSDECVQTHVATNLGTLAFQDYFVRARCAPVVQGITFSGVAIARPTPGVLEAISTADCLLIAPSNPWLSIDPILAVPGIKDALYATRAPIVAVSPLIAGKAVKGPTAKLMAELGLPVSNDSIAAHYGELLDGLLIDNGDDRTGLPCATAQCATLMVTLEDRTRVARAALDFALSIKK